MQTSAHRAIEAFEGSVSSTVGRASHLVEPTTGALSESVWERVAGASNEPVSPVITGSVSVIEPSGEGSVRLIGVDPLTYPLFQPAVGEDNPFPVDPFLAGESVAAAGGQLPERSSLTVEGASGEVELSLTGRLGEGSGRVLYVDVGLAQRLLDRAGELDRILLRTNEPEPLKQVLPEGSLLLPTGQRLDSTRSLLEAFRWNLYALGFLALFVGAFLVYGSMLVMTSRQRSTYSLLRTLGLEGRQMLGLAGAQVLILGLLGTGLGVLGGLLTSLYAGAMVEGTVDKLFAPLWTSGDVVDPVVLLIGAVVGLLVTMAGGLGPVLGLRSLPPRAWERQQQSGDRSSGRVWLYLLGMVLCGVTAVALIASTKTSLLAGFAACFLVALGGAFLAGPLVELVSQVPLGGMWERMAVRSVAREGGKTRLVAMTLIVAFSMVVAVSLMVGSFRSSVEEWVESVIRADVYISDSDSGARPTGLGLPDNLPERIRQQFAPASTLPQRRTRVLNPNGRPLTLVGLELGDPRQRDIIRFRDRAPDAWERLNEDGVLVSEPGSRRLDRGLGDTVALELPSRGEQTRTIVGIVEEYSTEWARIYVDNDWLAGWTEPVPVRDLAVFSNSVDASDIRDLVEDEAVVVRSNRELRDQALKEFDRTFAVTSLMRVIALIVAIVGLISTVIALNRTRLGLFGTLRAAGASRYHLFRFVAGETATITGLGVLVALPIGTLLAMLLLYVVNRRSFGWTIELTYSWGPYFWTILAAFLAWIAALIIPAYTLLTTTDRDFLRQRDQTQ